MEAMRAALKRRLSDIVYRQLVSDQKTTTATSELRVREDARAATGSSAGFERQRQRFGDFPEPADAGRIRTFCGLSADCDPCPLPPPYRR